ncbi:hypothetical protein CF319_g93 [Tilletia indica]|nr:hypothetical protein CF319_g93 [Tilletia indica]
MRVVNTLLLAVAALSSTCSVALAAPSSGDHVFNNLHATSVPSLGKRNEVRDIVSTIRNRKKGGSDFCSTFLHLPPYAKTTTSTITKTVLATAPASTFVKTASVTKTASPVTKYSTKLSVVDVTSTVFQTVASAVPSTSTVTTVTAVVSATTAVTQTITSYLPINDRRKNSGIPYWLQPHCSASISRACSHVVTSKTKTCHKTVTSTRTVKSGVSTVTNSKTATIVVTPTQNSVVTSISTKINPALTSTIVSASSSLVPVTATEIVTSFTTVTSTVVAALPVPTMTGRIKITNADGTDFGYFGSVSGDYGATSVADVNNAVLFTIALAPGSSGPFNMGNPSGSNFPYLGPVMGSDQSGSSGNKIGPGLYNYLILGNVAKVQANSQSTDTSQNSVTTSGGPQAVYESRVWSLDRQTNALSITWTNSDGSSTANPTLIAFQSQGATFFEWTGDEVSFRARYDGFLSQNLLLSFVPDV